MSAIADVQAACDVDAGFGERFDFVDERAGIDDDARADDGVAAWGGESRTELIGGRAFPCR